MQMLANMKAWARGVMADVAALYIAARDRRTPWVARVVALAVAAYALSPIDLIPDFVPVLGYLDDVILVPLGILLAVRLIPAPLLAEFRDAASRLGRAPGSRIAAALIVAVWICAIAIAAAWLLGPLPR